MNRAANIVEVEGMLSIRETLFVPSIIAIDWCDENEFARVKDQEG